MSLSLFPRNGYNILHFLSLDGGELQHCFNLFLIKTSMVVLASCALLARFISLTFEVCSEQISNIILELTPHSLFIAQLEISKQLMSYSNHDTTWAKNWFIRYRHHAKDKYQGAKFIFC